MKSAILVHGHHLFADNWQGIVWGDPHNGVYGRVPTGLREALRFDADLIIFPTGSSKKDGLFDGEYALKVARERIAEIPEFADMSAQKARAWLDNRAVAETTSQNTREEVIASGQLALARGVERLVQVSSPTHIMRAHRDALAAFFKDETLRPLLRGLYAIASDVGYSASVDDVLIIEPRHRPDRPKIPFNGTLKDIFLFNDRPDLAEELNTEFVRVFGEFKKRLR